MQHVTAPELAQWLADPERPNPILLDVRERSEFQTCHIDNALFMPMHMVPTRLAELDADAEIVCICHHGGRSMKVASFLEQNGFGKITNLTGGVHAWAQQVDPDMPTY
ncbi:MAG: sulfurtransferase [Burkholderiaceae bacterium]|nr:sulfurtransferase [Burkholderiaceae bacterium]